MAGSRHSLRVVPPESLGSRLRRQRRANDLTQAELAKQFGVRQQTIGAWERGERPQSRFFAELRRYLDLDEREFLSLIDSQAEMPAEQEVVSAEVEAADEDAVAMRMLARRFVEDQQRKPLPAEQAAEIYKNFIGYFRARSIDQ